MIRVWGRDAVELTNVVFRPLRGGPFQKGATERLRLGRIGEGLGDEVVVVRIEGAPAEVEVHCHGGHAARAMVLAAFVAAGAEERRPVAWVRDTARCLIHAEAEVDLMQAPTLRTAEILLEQTQGSLEDDIAGIIAGIRTDPERGRVELRALIERGSVGLRLLSGWRVALAGRPNVGKSRLLNRLAGYERAIVDPSPGTTRDIVSLRTAFDGWPVEVSDTAGLREANDDIERSGIELSRARHREADILLVVLDRSTPLADEDKNILAEQSRALIVANKCDLPAAWTPEPEMITISAERGDGIDRLVTEMVARLVPTPPLAGVGIPFRKSQVRALVEAERLLSEGEATNAAALLERFLGRPS